MRDPRIDLERMVISAEKVVEYAGALTFEEFITDGLRYDATLRNLEIMGEAAKRVSDAVREQFPEGTVAGSGWIPGSARPRVRRLG